MQTISRRGNETKKKTQINYTTNIVQNVKHLVKIILAIMYRQSQLSDNVYFHFEYQIN
jgi:uncharacterized membrane protein